MEYQLLCVGLLSLFLFLYCLLQWKNRTSSKKAPPQPSGAWPIIGHLHLIGDLPHRSLGKLADTYGPIFMMKLGTKKALVVSSPATARECLGGNNDRVFVGRPQTIFVEHLAYNSAMVGFSPYGPYWREMRKIINVELLSNQKLEEFKEVKMSEVRSAMKGLVDNYCGKPVEMRSWFNDLSLNNIVRLVAGKSLKEFYRGEEYEKVLKAVRGFFKFATAFVPADALPFIRWLDIGGYEKAMKDVGKDIETIAQGWLEEHKRKRFFEENRKKKDFMDVLLGICQTTQENASEFDADVIVKATSVAMILAASDTTAVTLTWALSLLLNHKKSMTKIQAEIDKVIGKKRKVEESDLKNLVYLQAVLKETMRLYPASPLSVPRESVSDCTVNGWHIPSGTQLFVNLYKIHRDPDSWQDPCEFRPERFLTTHKEYDVRGQNSEYTPFGSGRRICPGISFALQSMQFTLANLLHGFEVSTPAGETVDMAEGAGLTLLKANPLEVILIPRLPLYLYEVETPSGDLN